MFGSQILEVAIGLIFVYLLLGLLCTVLNEWIARLFALRSRTLKEGIRNLLSGKDKNGQELLDRLYKHPLIKGLYQQGWFDKIFKREGKPSYIHARTFALALLDIVAPEAGTGIMSLEDLRKTAGTLPDSPAKTSLLALMSKAEDDIKKARENIEQWFDDAMVRVSGWYKRRTQLIALGVALVVSAGLNVDTFFVANNLYRDPILRASVVAAAQEEVKRMESGNVTAPADTADTLTSFTRVMEIKKELEQLRLPMGWKDSGDSLNDFGKFVKKFFGWLLTAFALSLGAPFWFDVLKKLTSLRSTGKEPEKEA